MKAEIRNLSRSANYLLARNLYMSKISTYQKSENVKQKQSMRDLWFLDFSYCKIEFSYAWDDNFLKLMLISKTILSSNCLVGFIFSKIHNHCMWAGDNLIIFHGFHTLNQLTIPHLWIHWGMIKIFKNFQKNFLV